jgi:hypothetical protein
VPNFLVATTTATLVASTAYTALELRPPAGVAAKIVKWWVDFNSATSTDKPVLVQAGKFSAAVTTATAANPTPLSFIGSDTTASTAASVLTTAEGAGTASGQVESHYVLPQGGMYVAWETDDTALWVAPGTFYRIRLTPGSALTTTTANVGAVWVE